MVEPRCKFPVTVKMQMSGITFLGKPSLGKLSLEAFALQSYATFKQTAYDKL